MSYRHWLGRGLALTILFAAAVAAEGQTLLRYKFKEGQKLEYTSESKMKMTSDLGGIKIVINMSQNMEMSWKIDKVTSDGSAELVMRLDRMVMDIEAPPPIGAVRVDSNDKMDPENALAQPFIKVVRGLVGKDIKATMTPLGEFKDVKYPADLEKAMKDLGGLGGAGGGGVEQFAGGGVILPKDPVQKDKHWTHKTKTDIPKVGTAKVDTKYTYEGEDGDFQKILIQPKLLIEGEKIGLTLKVDEKKSKGVALFDNQDGRIHEIRTTQFMSANVEQAGLSIPMDMEITSVLKLKGKKK
ncbi:MAG: hypothetical protein U0793_26290 [Gemmataceae bacterium]